MIYSINKDKWPAQEHTLYEYRLSKNGTIECDSYDRYEIIKTARCTEYRIPSRSGIRHVKMSNLDIVKNNCVTSFYKDPSVAIKAFYEYYHIRKEKAKYDIDICNAALSIISKAEKTLTGDHYETN